MNLLIPEALESTLRERAKGYESFSEYLRFLLENNSNEAQFRDVIITNVLELHNKIEFLSTNVHSGLDPVTIETLLLLRALAKPEILNNVKAEMQRLGIKQTEL